MKNRILVGALVAGALLFTAGAASPAMAANNLIVNGDFSSPAGTASSSYAAGTNVGGWDLAYANPTSTPDALFIQRIGAGTSGHVSGLLLQSFPTEAGKTYTVSFHQFAGMSATTPSAGGKNFAVVAVSQSGASIASNSYVSPAVGAVVLTTFSFTAVDATTNLQFSAMNGPVGFDNISVTEVPVNDSPIMLPALAGGLGVAALAASGFVLRRKNKLASK